MRRNAHMVCVGRPEKSEGTVRISGQAVTNGKGSGCSPVLAGGFVEDVGEVMGNSFFAQPQLLGDFGVS